MRTQVIGQTGVEASRVALGVMRLAGRSATDAAATVGAALEAGITFFDSADIYGGGESSRALGRALCDLGVARTEVVLQTKAGIVPGQRYDFSRAHLMQALDTELAALQTDYVDFFLLHRPDPLVDLDEFAATMADMVASGKVRHIGVSNMGPWQVDMLSDALASRDIRLEVNQLQFGLGHTQAVSSGLHVNMADDTACERGSGVIEHARLRRMTVQAWSPFQFGTFAGCFIGHADFPELNAALDELAARHGTSATAVATAWILRHPARIQVICGSMSPAHIRDAAAGADVDLTAEEWWALYRAAGNDLP